MNKLSKSSKKELAEFQEEFLHWYDDSGRHYLPWRQVRTPYGTWVSEIMLQQTQVATVIPYYLNFMEQFPTIKSLSQADEEALLKAWEGLGYYSRVRNLQKGAQEVEEQFFGNLPQNYEELLKIKGIGPYTAGAISSMAFNEKVAAIDGNCLRVFSRLLGDFADISLSKTQKEMKTTVEKLMPNNRPGDFNQAVMDLGSLVCTPKNPQCDFCPLKKYCVAKKENLQEQLPVKLKKVKTKSVYYLALAVENHGDFYLKKRTEKGLLENMWHFPLIEVSKEEFSLLQKNDLFANNNDPLDKFLPEDFPETVWQKRNRGKVKHIYSHLKWEVLLFYGVEKTNSQIQEEKGNEGFFNLENTTLPLPKVQHKLMDLLEK